MKTVWLFGGSKKTFGQTLVNGFENVILFGRDNVNYSDIDGFIQSIEDNSIDYPIPDLIIFNILTVSTAIVTTSSHSEVGIAELRKLFRIFTTIFWYMTGSDFLRSFK